MDEPKDINWQVLVECAEHRGLVRLHLPARDEGHGYITIKLADAQRLRDDLTQLLP